MLFPQVFIGDILEKDGRATVEAFQTEFSPDAAHFCKVDVTNKCEVTGLFGKHLCKSVGNLALPLPSSTVSSTVPAGEIIIIKTICVLPLNQTMVALFSEFFAKAKETLGDLHIVVTSVGAIDEFQWEKCIDVNLVGGSCVLLYSSWVDFFSWKVFTGWQKLVS